MSSPPGKTETLLRRDDPKKTVLLAAPVKIGAETKAKTRDEAVGGKP